MNVYVAKTAEHQHASEQFDLLKLHRSVASACAAVRAFEGEAHLTAQYVCERVIEWLETKTEVTSADIRRVTGKALQVYHPDAAYVYEHYKGMV
jgi:hypothetical protein